MNVFALDRSDAARPTHDTLADGHQEHSDGQDLSSGTANGDVPSAAPAKASS
jgi:hypothetical protein